MIQPGIIVVLSARGINDGSREGAVVRALASHQCWPGFDSRSRRHMWVEFVVGSRPCSEGFLRVLRFSSLHKNQDFQILIRPGNSGEKSHSVDSTEIPIYSIYLFLFL